MQVNIFVLLLYTCIFGRKKQLYKFLFKAIFIMHLDKLFCYHNNMFLMFFKNMADQIGN